MKATGSIDLQAVVALANAIQQSPVWKAFEESNHRFDTDPDLQRLMDHYRELSEKALKARSQGEHLSSFDMADIQKTQEAMKNDEAFMRRQAAYGDLVIAFRAVNQALSEQLGLDFASMAAPPGGSCCG